MINKLYENKRNLYSHLNIYLERANSNNKKRQQFKNSKEFNECLTFNVNFINSRPLNKINKRGIRRIRIYYNYNYIY